MKIINQEIVVVDDEDADDVVIIDEKFVSNNKGKKPIHYPAQHEVITLDDVPSPRAESVKGDTIPNLFFVDGNFDVSDFGGVSDETSVPRSGKHAAPASSSSLFGTGTSSNSCKPSTSNHAQTDGLELIQSLHLGPEASAHNNLRIADGIAAEIIPPSADAQSNSSQDFILKKLEQFKKFDTLEDHLGHLYENKNLLSRAPYIFLFSDSQQPKKRVNRIADEWRMLEKDLPDTIFVRVYEARMDLLRAVILGADGTPYHDGLFFFDVHFTTSYPNSPPVCA
ncbi:putative ubiquitin-conjugating enzyme E2 25 [Bienertia sinuspersici]